jgi:hypothetical protein
MPQFKFLDAKLVLLNGSWRSPFDPRENDRALSLKPRKFKADRDTAGIVSRKQAPTL